MVCGLSSKFALFHPLLLQIYEFIDCKNESLKNQDSIKKTILQVSQINIH